MEAEVSRGPLVSFVVPCYNLGRYVGDCLASILGQEGDLPFEVVVIDDASDDESVRVIESFHDPRIRFLRHTVNAGHASTITEALSLTRGRFVARIDADDRYRPDFLRQTLPVFERHPEVVLVYGDAAMIDETGLVIQERMDAVHGERDFTGSEFLPLLEKNTICSPTVIARREGWLDLLPVPEHLAFHDWYFTLLMSRRGAFCYLHRTLADYRVHPANHHTAIARNGREEASILWMLTHVYSETEPDERLEEAKRRARNRVYAAHLRDLGDKYFWFGQMKAARRCYGRAARHRPGLLLDPAFARRVLGAVIGKTAYEGFKGIFRSREASSPLSS